MTATKLQCNECEKRFSREITQWTTGGLKSSGLFIHCPECGSYDIEPAEVVSLEPIETHARLRAKVTSGSLSYEEASRQWETYRAAWKARRATLTA